MKVIIVLLLMVMVGSCKSDTAKSEFLGMVNLEVSGAKEAIPEFERGLLLLHSFEYEDAREAFLRAQELDPTMPMAYWGEAMTYNHSLWSEQNYEDGVAVVKKIQTLDLEKNASQLERDFIDAVEILYQPKVEKAERDVAYANFMEGLSKKYPDNHEVSAFYALSLLGSVPDGRDEKRYEKGAKIAESVLQENPNHPGALHYMIHSYDDPDHATLALDAANAYAKVAPDASHALHMPSHIYVAMGMWDKVISSNIDSYQASLNRMERKNLSGEERGYHAYHWLQYGYLQQNNIEEARKMVLEMEKFTRENPTPRTRVHMMFLKGTYLNETDDWEDAISNIVIDVSDVNITVRSQYMFLEGMKAYHAKNTVRMDSVISILDDDINREEFVEAYGSDKLCSNASRADASPSDIVGATIRKYQLMALRENLDGTKAMAEQHFLKSIALQNSISYSYGPPLVQKPVYELYANWLMQQGRYKDADAHLKLAAKSGPGRRLVREGVEKIKANVQ